MDDPDHAHHSFDDDWDDEGDGWDDEGWDEDVEESADDEPAIADQIRDAFIDVAVHHQDTISTFDARSLGILRACARAILEASEPENRGEDLAQVMAVVFLAGRHHAHAGHPSPLPAPSHRDSEPLFVPDDWI